MTQANPIRVIALVSGEDTDCGKSSLARHAFRPALQELYGFCDYFLIEKMDRAISEGETQRFGPEDTPAVLTRCARARGRKESVVIEVGGGQSEEFIRSVEAYKGSENRVDQWVLPIRATQKADKIIETINRLITVGISPSKLAVVVNFVPAGRTASDVLSRDMSTVAAHAESYGYRILKNGIQMSQTIRDMRNLPEYTVGALGRTSRDYAAEVEVLFGKDRDDEANQLEIVANLSMGARGMIDSIDAMVNELLDIEKVDLAA